MIKKLRKKFIAIAMLSLLGTMIVLCTVISIADYYITTDRADNAIDMLYQNDGSFPDAPDTSFDPSRHTGFQVTQETPFETRYFIIGLTSDYEVYYVDLAHIAAVDRQTVITTIEEIVSQDKSRGYAGYYRFGSFENENGDFTLVVMDCFLQLQSAYATIRIVIVSFVLCAVIVFALLIVLSKRAIMPFAENWERQRRFVTDASHELKTPLAILSADMGLIDETEDNKVWLDSAHEQIVRMDGLIKNLVELARSEEELPEGALTDIAFSDIANSAADTFRPLAENGGKKLTAEIAPGLTTRGVQDELSRLLSLMLDNAVKYCDNGGEIKLKAFQQGKNICIEFSNPCAGTDPAQMSHWFDRFYRADLSRSRETGGSGIGLSTAKAIVQRHHGQITNRCEGDTVIFTVTLPQNIKGVKEQ